MFPVLLKGGDPQKGVLLPGIQAEDLGDHGRKAEACCLVSIISAGQLVERTVDQKTEFPKALPVVITSGNFNIGALWPMGMVSGHNKDGLSGQIKPLKRIPKKSKSPIPVMYSIIDLVFPVVVRPTVYIVIQSDMATLWVGGEIKRLLVRPHIFFCSKVMSDCISS